MRQNLKKAEKDIANIMTAIKAGIITPTTKMELERAEAERSQLEAILVALPKTMDKLILVGEQMAAFYRKMASNLKETLGDDIAQARQIINRLVGPIRLRPEPGGHLVAEIRRNHETLSGLLFGVPLKASVVAGTGFGSNFKSEWSMDPLVIPLIRVKNLSNQRWPNEWPDGAQRRNRREDRSFGGWN